MVARVLIVGGYGTFGSRIAARLAADKHVQIIVGGRSAEKARALATGLDNAANPAEWRRFDYRRDFKATLKTLRPDIVIHTSGPFQDQGYDVARHCIAANCHYADLADARVFVVGIGELDKAARARNVLVASGASSVPALAAAIIDAHLGEFRSLDSVRYGIATAQRTNRGLATAAAVLSYAGKPFTTLTGGEMQTVYGWQDLHYRDLPVAGRRLFANCDIPDLQIFPDRYPDLRTIRFHAGLEVPVLQIGLWLMTWPVRWRLMPGLRGLAPLLLKIARLFDPAGSDVSAFYMDMQGTAKNGRSRTVTFDLTARSGDGLVIPCAPAIILARRLAGGTCRATGATPCVGLIDLPAYLEELRGLDIEWDVSRAR